MRFQIFATEFFTKQLKDLDKKSKTLIRSKTELIKLNPHRFKKVHSKKFSRVFRVWINVRGRSTRLVYAVIGDKIFLVCLLDRDKDYRDLEKYLKLLR